MKLNTEKINDLFWAKDTEGVINELLPLFTRTLDEYKKSEIGFVIVSCVHKLIGRLDTLPKDFNVVGYIRVAIRYNRNSVDRRWPLIKIPRSVFAKYLNVDTNPYMPQLFVDSNTGANDPNLKSPELKELIGKLELTERQWLIIGGLREGKNQSEIARDFELSRECIRKDVQVIREQLIILGVGQ